MGQWVDAITSHPVHETFVDVGSFIESFPILEGSEVAEGALSRARIVVNRASALLRGSDPILINPVSLTQLQKQLNTIKTELSAFTSDGNDGHFQNVHNHADQILEISVRFPSTGASAEAAQLVESITQVRQRGDHVLEDLTARSGEVREDLGRVQALTEKVQQDLDAARTEITNQKARLDTAISEFQSQFSDAEDRRRQSFGVSSQQFSERNTEAMTEERRRVDEAIETNDQASQAILEQLGAKRQEAIDLVHVIGNVGVTGNFKGVADAEKQAADRMRVFALVSMMLIVAGVAATLWVAARPEARWHEIAIRIGITLALAVPATYAARESAGHRRVERATRRLELELASIDPYLEKLPESERNEVKKKLSERFFGNPGTAEIPEESPISKQGDVISAAITTLGDLVKRAIDQLAKK